MTFVPNESELALGKRGLPGHELEVAAQLTLMVDWAAM